MPMVNHNYPLENSLRVVNELNEPIEAAQIRVYELTPFEAGVIDTWYASTTSDVDGYWVDPIDLPAGQTLVVHMQKANTYGPNHVEITT